MADSANPFDDEPGEPVLRRRRPERLPVTFAPEPAPPLREPSLAGSLLGRSPTTTLGEQIGRWYTNAGGLDKAVEGAQQAQRDRNPRVLDNLLWPKWQPSDVTERRAPVTQSETPPTSAGDGVAGLWYPKSGRVWVKSNDPNKQATLEHELSHNAYLRDQDTADKQEFAAREGRAGWAVPHGGDEKGNYAAYTLDPTEVDVRLAEIKRHYAHHTGNLVNTPEEAQKAWEWWRSNSRNFSPGFNERIERPEDSPTLAPGAFKRYDELPDTMKQQMFHRMPELVNRGNVIRDLRKQVG